MPTDPSSPLSPGFRLVLSGAAAGIACLALASCSPAGGVPSATDEPQAGGAPVLELGATSVELTGRGTFVIRNGGGAALEWSSSEDVPWAAVSPSSGRLGRGEVPVEVIAEVGTLTPGLHEGLVRIVSNGGAADVRLRVRVGSAADGPPEPPLPLLPDSAPAARQPPSSSRGFSGSVQGIFGTGPVAAASVTVGGLAASTDADGRFTTDLPPSGVQPVTVSAPGWVARSTFAATDSGVARPLTLIPAAFDLAAYADLAREAAGTTVRWSEAPRVYLDVRPERGSGTLVPARWAAAAEAAAREFPSRWTDGRIVPPVEVGTAPPAAGTAGTIVIRFDDTINSSGCGARVGQAQFGWAGDGRLSFAVVRLALSRLCGADSEGMLRAVVGHELGHAMGLGHATLPGRPSLMEPNVRLQDLSALDRQVARVHYGRAPGHAAPDVEGPAHALLRFARGRAPLAAEERTYVCGEPARP
ncbi:MAG: hypothetical protein ABR599_08725 [Gemmatimonadota bacterium]